VILDQKLLVAKHQQRQKSYRIKV